jgi:hypothetical protein
VVVGSTATVRCCKRRRKESVLGDYGRKRLVNQLSLAMTVQFPSPGQPNSDMDRDRDRDKDWCFVGRHAMLIS